VIPDRGWMSTEAELMGGKNESETGAKQKASNLKIMKPIHV